MMLLAYKGLPLVAVPQRLYGTLDSFELLAVPMFLLMSNILLKGGVGRDLFAAVQSWVGHWPGGLGGGNNTKLCSVFCDFRFIGGYSSNYWNGSYSRNAKPWL